MSSKESILIESHYLPSLEYFASLFHCRILNLEAQETFQKQTFRNRCRIMTSNKIDSLVIPVLGASRNIPITEIKIDYKQKWLNTHWRAISSAYGKSPFFEYYADYFKDIYYRNHVRLFDLNNELLTLCLKCLQIDLEIRLTETYADKGENSLRSSLLPNSSFEERFIYRPIRYNQIFGKDFVPNLSVIDLLFCEGPNARAILKQSIVNL